MTHDPAPSVDRTAVRADAPVVPSRPADASTRPLVEIRDLTVRFRTRHGEVTALHDVDLDLRPGAVRVVIGESGSGKSVLASALLGLLPRNVDVDGTVHLDGRPVLDLPDRHARRLRAGTVGFVPQSPATALNPVRRIGPALLASLRTVGLDRDAARHRLASTLATLDLDLDDLWARYPHHLSVGMQQRALTALALARRPKLVVADEPTASLDADLARETARRLRRLVEAEAALLVITHDLGLAEALGGRLALLYAGRVVEDRPTRAFFDAPAHPYGRALLAARPDAGGHPIPGLAPSAVDPPPGCAFAPRCPHVEDRCTRRVPSPLPLADGHCRCVLHAAR